jgi:hypothetical protein
VYPSVQDPVNREEMVDLKNIESPVISLENVVLVCIK